MSYKLGDLVIYHTYDPRVDKFAINYLYDLVIKKLLVIRFLNEAGYQHNIIDISNFNMYTDIFRELK